MNCAWCKGRITGVAYAKTQNLFWENGKSVVKTETLCVDCALRRWRRIKRLLAEIFGEAP